MSYKLAVFDLDGTILNTLGDLADSVNHILECHGMPLRSSNEIRSYLGNGARRLIELAAPSGTPDGVIDALLEEYRVYYNAHSADKTAPYDGIRETLVKLRNAGCKTAVLSNKPDAPTVELCGLYFGDLFDFVAGEKAGIPRKPAPNGLYPMFEKFGISPSDAVFIGDSEVDVLTAKNAGIDGIAVGWGFRDTDELVSAGASRIVFTADELFRAVTE